MKLIPLFTVPRSGSELLCNALRVGGIRYAAELNHPGYRKALAQEFGAELEDMSLQTMIRFFERSPPKTDHIAFKVFYSDIHDLSIEPFFASITPIYLERFDFASQVVSFVAMSTSGRALDNSSQTIRNPPRMLDEGLVKASIAFLRHERRMWAKTLAERNVFRIMSEDLIGDPDYVLEEAAKTFSNSGLDFDWRLAAQTIRKSLPYDQDAKLKARIRSKYAYLLDTLIAPGHR